MGSDNPQAALALVEEISAVETLLDLARQVGRRMTITHDIDEVVAELVGDDCPPHERVGRAGPTMWEEIRQKLLGPGAAWVEIRPRCSRAAEEKHVGRHAEASRHLPTNAR